MSEEIEKKEQGVFVTTLLRDNKSIKKDRAQAIIEDSEMVYKRKVEDMGLKLKRLKREQDAILDLSPDNSLSLMPNLKTFEAEKFANDDLRLALEIRNLEIQIEVSVKRYEYLFGEFKSTSYGV